MMTEQKQQSSPNYSSYLLRLWLPIEGKNPNRLVSLQNLTTGERIDFAHLDSLFRFLEAASQVTPNFLENSDDESGQGGRCM